MKTTFGLKKVIENIESAKEGKINLFHINTEMSLYNRLSTGGEINVTRQISSTQKQSWENE